MRRRSSYVAASLRAALLALPVSLGLAGCASTPTRDAPSPVPTALTVEYATQPLGLDVIRPRLAWRLPTAGSDGAQTAYRLRVATRAEDLDAAPLWDSGKTASARSSQIEYAGPSLSSRSRYYWQVQTWDGADRASGWSAPSSWEMGLLTPEDWSAQWISGRLQDDHDWRDGRLQIDFTLTGKSFGILFRARPVGKTYGETYLWTLAQEGGRVRLVQQLRRYAGGSSSKVNVVQLRSVDIAEATPDWLAQRHRIVIETAGERIATTVDDGAPHELRNAVHARGTIGFTAAEDAAAVIHAVDMRSDDGDFATDFADGINPFTGGSLRDGALHIAAGVADKDLVLPIGTPAPLLRRALQLRERPLSARLYLAAGGLPAFAINGHAVGEAMQDGYTDYGKRVLVRAFDVTGLLRKGENVLSAELGRGWYAVSEPNEWYWHMAPWRAAPALRAQLELRYADGSTQRFGTDADWRTIDGPTRHDSVFAGERYDARLLPRGWQQPGFDDGAWAPAKLVDGPAGALSAAAQEPIGVTGMISPVAITEPLPGVYVFDFGRIFSGRLRLDVKGPRGTTVRMIQMEKLDDHGTVTIASGHVDAQLQTDQYTLSGSGRERWFPKFGYRGIRYVQVEGFPGKPGPGALTGELMHSQVDTVPFFESAHPLLNRIQDAARNTLLNNLFGNVTDTPTYEKNGWTGDAQASALAAILNFDLARVWTKWLADFRDAQSDKGEIPEIVPSTPYYGYENTPGWDAVWGPIPSWDAATFVLPWEMYLTLGDRRILAQMYDTQKKLIDYTGSYFTPDRLSYRNPHNFLLGEYAAVMPEGGLIAALRQQPNGPVDATASAYYFHMLDRLSQSAALLGKDKDAAHYRALAERVREAYNARYWDADERCYLMPKPTEGFAQSPNILAVAFGLVPDGEAATVMRRLNDDIVRRGYHLGAGVYAGRHVMTLLADYGYADTAYRVATNAEFPSWGYWIENGLSTMAEGWELSSRSWSHHYWASISSYFYQSLLGLRPLEPGYARTRIRPQIPDGLEWARGELKTPFGPLRASWTRDERRLRLDVEIPPGIDAEVWLPGDGASSSAPPGTTLLGMREGHAVYRAGAGRHTFVVGQQP